MNSRAEVTWRKLGVQVWTWGEPWGDFSMKVDRHAKKVEGASDIVKLACGAFHNLALNSAGEGFTWGINDFGGW